MSRKVWPGARHAGAQDIMAWRKASDRRAKVLLVPTRSLRDSEWTRAIRVRASERHGHGTPGKSAEGRRATVTRRLTRETEVTVTAPRRAPGGAAIPGRAPTAERLSQRGSERRACPPPIPFDHWQVPVHSPRLAKEDSG
jgi:hypothetical protein